MVGTDILGTANYLKDMNPPYDEDKAEGYYLAINVEPWEGAQWRIRRSGEWGEWIALVDNGKALSWLGKDAIIADAIEVKDTAGVVTTYHVGEIIAGPKPVAMAARAKKATRAVKAKEA